MFQLLFWERQRTKSLHFKNNSKPQTSYFRVDNTYFCYGEKKFTQVLAKRDSLEKQAAYFQQSMAHSITNDQVSIKITGVQSFFFFFYLYHVYMQITHQF